MDLPDSKCWHASLGTAALRASLTYKEPKSRQCILHSQRLTVQTYVKEASNVLDRTCVNPDLNRAEG